MDKKETPQSKYDRKMSRAYGIKLNRKTDKDLIDTLDSKPSMQGYIKSLIRADIDNAK
jgi:hypothetical protein